MTGAATGSVPAPRDPGRQPERTRLSWRRTMLAATVVALLASRQALPAPAPVAAAAIAAVAAGWLLLLAVSGRRIVDMSAAVPAPVRWAVPLAALATTGFAALGLGLLAIA